MAVSDRVNPGVEQTISFTLRVQYRYIERVQAGLPESVDYHFVDFCDMMDFARKESRRRRYADRSTGSEYRQVLTQHGRDMINGDDWTYTEDRYRDAIDGTWFKVR